MYYKREIMALIITLQFHFLFTLLILFMKSTLPHNILVCAMHIYVWKKYGHITWSTLKVFLGWYNCTFIAIIITLTVILCMHCMISSSHKSKDPQILHESSLLKSELAITDEGFLWFTYNPICTKGLRFSLEARIKPISPVQNLLISTLWWISCHVA